LGVEPGVIHAEGSELGAPAIILGEVDDDWTNNLKKYYIDII
jgi:hypothetical protein